VKKILLYVAIIGHAIAMIIFTLYLMKLPWLAGDEKFLIWSTSALKFANRETPPSEDFAFINTSYDLQLIDRIDEYGFPVGNQVITDRMKLAQLFNILNSGEVKSKYIFCDIHFVDPTEDDSLLYDALKNTDNIILSAHLNDMDELENPLFEGINRGLSDYVIGSVFDGVYKYQLIYEDTLKLTPLKVYEDLTKEEIRQAGPLVKIGNRWTLNNFIMNYRLLQKDIEDLEAGFNPVGLGELLYLEDRDIQEFTAGKIVLIGDFFEQDMHETLFEITSGPLILLNAFLSIQAGDTIVNFGFFLLLFIVYCYLSYMVFVEGDYMEKQVSKLGSVAITKYLIGFASYLILLTMLSVATFFLFNIHINIVFVAVAFYVMDKLVGLLRPVLKL
jgi:hypothetical protein